MEDTGIFAEQKYFDVFVEYAKNDVDDILIRLRIVNRGPEKADLTLLPTLWFRNIWSWTDAAAQDKPRLSRNGDSNIAVAHKTLGNFTLNCDGSPEIVFTNNETNTERIFGWKGENCFYKDAFHEYVIHGKHEAVNSNQEGTKACAIYRLSIEGQDQAILHFRLARDGSVDLPAEKWDGVFDDRIRECMEFYGGFDEGLSEDARHVQRQAFAGMFWSKQYYHFVIENWLKGDPTMPKPPASRLTGRDSNWRHLFNEDVISMPDKWEYPWYAAWDLAFHAVAMAPADSNFAKAQLSLFVREWYMHPNGQIPAYEWAFGDVNPPVHAWATWRVFKIDQRIKGKPDHDFLERVFHKLLMNFTWWVNRKDSEGANIFEGGFLGLDNIGIFDRSAPLPSGWTLEQSDGSAWMAMYCLNMLKISLQLAFLNPCYEDIASKFFEHFLYICDAINHYDGSGLWDEQDGFYYDRLRIVDGPATLLRVRSLVGLVPLFATDTLEQQTIDRHPGFKKRMQWFIDNRPDLTEGLASMTEGGMEERRLLSVVNKERLQRILQRMFDESEFLSDFGIRSVSRYHKEHPYELHLDGTDFKVAYEPAESESGTFGGNSNWRGPVWFPMNYLIIEALQRMDHYYGDSLTVEVPTGSGKRIGLRQAAQVLSVRLAQLFLPGTDGTRPVNGCSKMLQTDRILRIIRCSMSIFTATQGRVWGRAIGPDRDRLIAKLLQQNGFQA